MLLRIARYTLVFITIITLAIYLPDFFWKAFDQRVSRPYAQYSPVIDDFIIMKGTPEGPVYHDTKGNDYSRSQADSLLPLFNARQLLFEGRFPDSLRGIKIEPELVRLNSFMIRVNPADISQEQIQLFPLFESQSGRVRLELPETFFRIGKRMEFISTATNTIDKELSRKFNQALREKGFEFPATLISGNPTTRKPFDEGYFVRDSQRPTLSSENDQG